MDSPELKLLSPRELAAIYGVTSTAVLNWYRAGTIPAEIAEGKIYRFDLQKVSGVLAERAKKDKSPESPPNSKLPTHALVI